MNNLVTNACRLLGRWRKPGGSSAVLSAPVTPNAQRTLSSARDEAERLKHNFIGTEHILLSLTKLGQGGAFEVMGKLGLEPETVRLEIERRIGTGPDQNLTGSIPWTPRVKKAIALAEREAEALNHPQVGTGHILLGLLREGGGMAALVLNGLDTHVEETRREFMDWTAREAASPTPRIDGENPVAEVPAPRVAKDRRVRFAANEGVMSNFTPRAHQALALARTEAIHFGHNFLGTEHALLGIVKLGRGVAVNVLRKSGLDLETVRLEVEKQIGCGPDQAMLTNIPFTPRVRKVLDSARWEAKSLNHKYVGTGHILLGLLCEGDGVAGRVLKSLGVDREKTREAILRELAPPTIDLTKSDLPVIPEDPAAPQKAGENQTPDSPPSHGGQTG